MWLVWLWISAYHVTYEPHKRSMLTFGRIYKRLADVSEQHDYPGYSEWMDVGVKQILCAIFLPKSLFTCRGSILLLKLEKHGVLQ